VSIKYDHLDFEGGLFVYLSIIIVLHNIVLKLKSFDHEKILVDIVTFICILCKYPL